MKQIYISKNFKTKNSSLNRNDGQFYSSSLDESTNIVGENIHIRPSNNELKSSSLLTTSAITATSPFYFTTGVKSVDSNLENGLYLKASNKDFNLNNFAREASLFTNNSNTNNTTTTITANKIKFKKKKLNKASSEPSTENSENKTSLSFDLNDPNIYDIKRTTNEQRHQESEENVEEKDNALYDMIARIQSDRLDNQRCQLNQDYSVSI